MDIIYRFDPFASLSPVKVHDAAGALARLQEGNQFFTQMVDQIHDASSSATESGAQNSLIIPTDPIAMGIPVARGLAPKQSPFALVLGCCDARVPVEHLFHCSSNELVVVRLAGNVLTTEGLGSVEYAVRYLTSTLRAVIVLGHTECEAVTAAVDQYLQARECDGVGVSRAMRSITDRMMVSVRRADEALRHIVPDLVRDADRFRRCLIECSVYVNAATNARDLVHELHVAAGTDIRFVHSVYDVRTTRISSLPTTTGAVSDEFLTAANTVEGLTEYVEQAAIAAVESIT